MQYNRARWYDAHTGKWTSVDPLGFAAGDRNLYRYVGNGPTNASDPSGLKIVEIFGGSVEYDDPVVNPVRAYVLSSVNGKEALHEAPLDMKSKDFTFPIIGSGEGIYALKGAFGNLLRYQLQTTSIKATMGVAARFKFTANDKTNINDWYWAQQVSITPYKVIDNTLAPAPLGVDGFKEKWDKVDAVKQAANYKNYYSFQYGDKGNPKTIHFQDDPGWNVDLSQNQKLDFSKDKLSAGCTFPLTPAEIIQNASKSKIGADSEGFYYLFQFKTYIASKGGFAAGYIGWGFSVELFNDKLPVVTASPAK